MAGRTVVQPFFMTTADEEAFSIELLKEFPAIKFIDNSRWPTPAPVLVSSIANCSSNYAFLWPSDLVAELPYVAHGNQYNGPQSGVVMQVVRSRMVDGCLMSGQLGVGFFDEDAWMKKWSREVINILRRLNTIKLKATRENAVTGTYVVGPDAAKYLKNGGCFKHNLGGESYEAA
jgi:hypothetical protein